MKKAFLFSCFFAVVLTFSANVFGQKQIAPQVVRDPVMEADALHDLAVARQAFKERKAYKAVLLRTEVILAAYPDFSRVEDVLYLSGMSSYFLSENKGRQKFESFTADEKKKYAPEKMREDAGAFLTQLIAQFPNSKYRTEAEKTLKSLEAKNN